MLTSLRAPFSTMPRNISSSEKPTRIIVTMTSSTRPGDHDRAGGEGAANSAAMIRKLGTSHHMPRQSMGPKPQCQCPKMRRAMMTA